MKTDPLNIIQNNNTSTIGMLMPDVNGNRKYITPTSKSSFFNGHSMNNMLKEFGINPSKYSKR